MEQIQVTNLIIGFGKAGKTLAADLARAGESVLLVERDAAMYGGTCINVGCIPSKTLLVEGELSARLEDKDAAYHAAMARKTKLITALRAANYDKLVSIPGLRVLTAEAYFVGPHRLRLEGAEGRYEVTAARIFINTGALPFVPPIEGAAESTHVYTSETMMELDELPEKLVIIGGGYIGLEFASYYANFGSSVAVVQDGSDFIPREDREIAARVMQQMNDRGIHILTGAKVQRIEDGAAGANVIMQTEDGEKTLAANAILVATGRRPNTAALNLAAAGVAVTERGAVAVDEHLRTNVPHIWAMGDVAGGLQFTYISLDDFRIVKDQLGGTGARTTANRGVVPYAVFLDPPLSRVGMTEEQAQAAGFDVRVTRLEVAAIPKAQVYKKPAGVLKAIIDAKTDTILGAHFFCPESQEMINLMKMAIDHGITAAALGSAIYTHPTMTEALNDLFG